MMPVDDAKLDKLIADTTKEYNDLSFKRGKLRQLLADANSIKQKDVPDPTEGNPRRTKKEMPVDTRIGKKITPSRRQEIFDKIKADKVTLGF